METHGQYAYSWNVWMLLENLGVSEEAGLKLLTKSQSPCPVIVSSTLSVQKCGRPVPLAFLLKVKRIHSKSVPLLLQLQPLLDVRPLL